MTGFIVTVRMLGLEAIMTEITERLQACREGSQVSEELIRDAIQEIRELRKERDALEEILIILSRTEVPWDEEGKPTDALPHFQERYVKAMHDASKLLGLDVRSTITRTEPKT